jgi:hypothetical protein
MLNRWQRSVTMLKYWLLVSIFCPVLTGCHVASVRGAPSPVASVLSLSAGKTLATLGVKPQRENGSGAEDAAWRDRRVAFGLTNLLAESFYDTGKFRLVEEKDLHQRQRIEELVDLFWSASRPEPSDPDLTAIGRRLEADLLAYGTIGHTRSSNRRIQAGPFGSYQQRLRVTLEVCLYEVSTQKWLCREGEGAAEQEGVGVVYEFRNDRPDFEKTAAGLATKQAVTSAVQALVASIRFVP